MKRNILRRIIGIVEEMIQIEEVHEQQVDMQMCVLLQEKAIVAGNLIEQSVEEAAIMIKLLEEFCELVYSMSLESEDSRENADGRLSVLKRVLSELSQIIEVEKSKIVFMPYKSCMWDAMETIYTAALEESDEWDVRVMPVPYVLKKEGRMVYEGEYFKEKVGYTHYQEYDLEQEKPDVIVIHNPYDHTNTVTQIEERYFSSELIKVTKHLVYVPYFIAQNNEIPWRFAILPGVRNATDIYVQSEQVRKQYLEWHPNKNIKALGTPKVDRIVNESVYEEKERKVFFLNTHLDKVLNEPKTLIKNMQMLLDYFEDNDQYELIWRPHPLSMTCFEEAGDAKRYAKLIERAKKVTNILYDESDDFWDTMKRADAYIGDRSSLVDLFGMTGKPMYIFEGDCGDIFKNTLSMSFLDCYEADGKLWMVDSKMPAVFSMNLENQQIQLECVVDSMQGAYRTIRKKGDVLYLFPEVDKSIIKIDLQTKEQKHIDIYMQDGNTFFGTQEIVEYQGYYYIFPAYVGQPLIKFDGECVEECRGWKDQIQSILNRKSGTLTDSSYSDGKEVWMAVLGENKLIKTDLDSLEIQAYQLQEECKLETLMHDDGRFWLSARGENPILCWSVAHGIEEIYSKIPAAFKFANRYSFCRIVRYEDEVWFIPRNASDILILNTITGEYEIFDVTERLHLTKAARNKFYAVKRSGDYLILFPMVENSIFVIDMKNKQVKNQIEAIPKREDFRKIEQANLESKNVYSTENCLFVDFVTFVEQHYKISQEQKESYLKGIENPGNSGQMIWNDIRDMG